LITKSPGLHHILEQILMELNQEDLEKCQQVNQVWNNMITNKSLRWYDKLFKQSLLSHDEKTKWRKLIGKLSKCDSNQIEYMKSHFRLMQKQGDPVAKEQYLLSHTNYVFFGSSLNRMDPFDPEFYPDSLAKEIFTATKNRNVEFIRIIAAITDDPNDPYGRQGLTPIQMATTKATERKLKDGKLIDARTAEEKFQYAEIIQSLAPYAENPNALFTEDYYLRPKRLRTPIQLACKTGNAEIVRILAPFCKNPNAACNDSEFTMIQTAAERPTANTKYTDVIKALLPFTDNPNASDPNGWTPLQRAAKNGNAEIVKLLLPVSDNPNVTDPDGFTPIQTAAAHGHSEIRIIWLFT
jgi:ankyrin repeat protein